jgi:hypothetical protein
MRHTAGPLAHSATETSKLSTEPWIESGELEMTRVAGDPVTVLKRR